MSEDLLSEEEIKALLAGVNASKENQPVKAEAAGSVSPVAVEGSNEQNANPDNNEMQEFLDSQKELIVSGKAYIDELVTNESAEIPQFNDSTFRSKLYGESCTKNSQVTALENYYEEYIKDKYQKNTEGQIDPMIGRAHKMKLRVRVYDAARAVEDQINADQERPLSVAELQKGIKENIALYMRDLDVDVLRDPDMLKACLLLKEGFTDEDLKNHLGALDEVLKDPLFVVQAVLIKEAVTEGTAILVSKEESSPQEIQSNVLEKKTEKEIVVEEGTQFPDADGDITWVVEKIEGDKVFIRPVGVDDPNFKSKEVDLSELKERLNEIEAERAKAESISKGLVKDYETFRNNHNEIIDKRFEGKGRVKKMMGGFFRNSSARVAIGMIIGVSSSLALGANPLASSTVMLTRSLTRSALSMFGFGTGNKARAIGNEQARVMKTLEYGLSDDMKRPGQEDFKEEEYNQALVENYKKIPDSAEKARVLATLVEIADRKGQKINTAEYKNQIESIRKGKDVLKAKNGTLARFDEYREKFSKMSLVKKIGLSAAIAIVSIGVATGVGAATGATLTTSLGALAFFKSVGLASGTIGGMLTSGAIGMASGALMSNPEKTTDYSENSALVDALGKEYFDGGGEEEDLKQYYKEVNNRFNVALAKGVGVGLVFANAMTIFGLGKDALDHFKGHGANGGNETVVGTTGKPGMPEPTHVAKPLAPPPLTGSGQPSAPGQTEPAPLSSGIKTPAEMPHELSRNEFDAKIANFGTSSNDLNAEKALAGGSLEGKNGHGFMDQIYKGLEGKHGLPAGAENHDQVVQQMTDKAKEMGVIDSHGNLTDKIDASKFDPQDFTRAVVQHDDNYLHALNNDLSASEQSTVPTDSSAEPVVSTGQHGAEPVENSHIDKIVTGASPAQAEVSATEHIDKEVASKINQANIDPNGKSFEKATRVTMDQVNKIIRPANGKQYMEGWFGGFLHRGIDHGYLKEDDFRVMMDQTGHPQLKIDLSHFPSQERTGINSDHIGIGLKGIPENAGIDSVYKDRPWWDPRSHIVKVNAENALANKAVHGAGTPMPTPEGHQKVDIAGIKQNSTDGIIRFKAEDVDPTTETDFPNSSAGHTAPEHGTIPETKTSTGSAVPESVITNKIEPAHFDASYWKSPEGLSQLNGNAEIRDAGIFNIKGPTFDSNGKLQDADFTFNTSELPPDMPQATAGMPEGQRLIALHNYYLNTIRDQIETK